MRSVIQCLFAVVVVFTTVCSGSFTVILQLEEKAQAEQVAKKRPSGPAYAPLSREHAVHITRGTTMPKKIDINEDGVPIYEIYLNLNTLADNTPVGIPLESILEMDGRVRLSVDDKYHRFTIDGAFYGDEDTPRAWIDTCWRCPDVTQDRICWLYMKFTSSDISRLMTADPPEEILKED